MLLEILVEELTIIGLLLWVIALFIYKYQENKSYYWHRANWIKLKELEYYNELKDEELDNWEQLQDFEEAKMKTIEETKAYYDRLVNSLDEPANQTELAQVKIWSKIDAVRYIMDDVELWKVAQNG